VAAGEIVNHDPIWRAPQPRPEQCAICFGREFEGIDVGTWDGVSSGVFYTVRCLNCCAVWETYPSNKALNAGEPLEWRPVSVREGTTSPKAGQGGHGSLRRSLIIYVPSVLLIIFAILPRKSVPGEHWRDLTLRLAFWWPILVAGYHLVRSIVLNRTRGTTEARGFDVLPKK